jgi:hypothetical protein
MGETHRPYFRSRRAQNTISIFARNQVGRHRVYPGHYPRIFIAPKNARTTETKRQSGVVPILLLVILALTTSAYSSLNVLQESRMIAPGMLTVELMSSLAVMRLAVGMDFLPG